MYSKMHPTLGTNTHHDFTIFEVDEMIKNIKIDIKDGTWLFYEIEKSYILCLKDHIFRSNHVLVLIALNGISDPVYLK